MQTFGNTNYIYHFRCNLFVFDFTSCAYWVLSNLMQGIVCIENIPRTNEFILGNKEGLLLVFDSGKFY